MERIFFFCVNRGGETETGAYIGICVENVGKRS